MSSFSYSEEDTRRICEEALQEAELDLKCVQSIEDVGSLLRYYESKQMRRGATPDIFASIQVLKKKQDQLQQEFEERVRINTLEAMSTDEVLNSVLTRLEALEARHE